MALRKTVTLMAALLAWLCLAAGAQAAEPVWHHALSLVGKPKYPPDFKHFKWANPDAPKGGAVRLHALGTFDSLNQFPVKGNTADLLGLIYDSLMAGSPDEPSTEYGLIAEAVSYPDDYSSVTFRLRPQARFHDGEPVKPEDVIFSFETITKVSPNWAFYYKNVKSVEKTGANEVTFRFDIKGNRELPQIVGQLTVLPKHYWTGNDADGKPRDLSKTTLEPPLGSGPYRIKEIRAGRSITYKRVDDYWARDLPVVRGQWNFDEIRVEYFRDTTVAFEAFKAGQLDYFQETSSKNWATGYKFKARENGLVKKEAIPLKRAAPMQAFVLNLRHKKFADPRVREAFNLAFDFEWSNKNLFYGQYTRVSSYFENSELASKGLPEGREKEILEALKKEFPDDVPDEALTKAYKNPVNADRNDFRRNLRRATRLLKQAGWDIKGGALTNERTGEKMEVEFLIISPAFERIILPYIQNLKRLGIAATVRLVDSSQYRARLDRFDFDIVTASFPQSESPGNEQRDFWGSAAAKQEGSRNLIGIQSPAIDKLIDMIIFAKSRAELVAVTHALDRVLLWHHFVVPQWFSPDARIAYWIKFGRPETLPSQSPSFLQVWWFDPEAARKLETATQ
jgi:microcin C transport system substrate-binding protein